MTILVEKKEGNISIDLYLENEIREYKIPEKFLANSSDSKKYKIGQSELIIEFDSEMEELKIKNSGFVGDNFFHLNNYEFCYNDSFITEVLIKTKKDTLKIRPNFMIFEDSFREVIEDSIENLEKLQGKLNQKYQELCTNSINHLQTIQKNFPCFLKSRYDKLIKSLDELDFMESKEILEIMKTSTKNEFYFTFGKKEEKRIDFDDIDEYSNYDEEKPKIEEFHKQQLPVLKSNLRTIIKILNTEKYITKIERTKLIRLEHLVKQIEYVRVDPKKSILDDLNDLLSEILGIISAIAGPLLSLISATIGILNTVKKANEIKENLRNEKYEKDTYEPIKTKQETYTRENEINIERRSVESIKRDALRKADYAIQGRKASKIIKLIAANRGHCGATYRSIANGLPIRISESWVREVVQRLNRSVLQIYQGRPHTIDIYSLDERDFWSRIYRIF